MQIFKKLLSLLTPSERKRAGVLMGMILVMAFLDMLGVASILPFMAALEQTVDCFVASLLAMTGNLISLEFGVILDMLLTYPKGRQEFS